MAPEELLAAVRERPFKPFRMRLTDGRFFDVFHPEMVLPGRRSAILGLIGQASDEPLFERHVTIDVFHIVSLDPLATPTPSGQN